MGELEGLPDPSSMRITHADRDRVSDLLRDAAGDGRIDLDELDERLEAAAAAKTYADLVPITADLAAPAPRPSGELVAPGSGPSSSTAVLGDCKRLGVWSLGAEHTAFGLMGDVTLDLRQVTFEARETVITANAFLSSVKIWVNERTRVVVEGTAILGDFKQGADKVTAALDADSPVVRVRGVALMGDVKVQRLPPPGTPKKYLGTY